MIFDRFVTFLFGLLCYRFYPMMCCDVFVPFFRGAVITLFIMSYVGSRSCSPIAPWDMEVDEWPPAYSPFASDWRDDFFCGVGPGGDIAITGSVACERSSSNPVVAPSREDIVICARDVRRVLFMRHCLGVSSLFNGRE